MIFNLFKKHVDDKAALKGSVETCEFEQDALNEKTTRIAIDLIQRRGGSTYLQGMRQVFRATPQLIKDVDPEYRAALQKVLEQE